MKNLGYCSECSDKKFTINPIKQYYAKVYNYLGYCRECEKRTIIWKLEDLSNTSKDPYAVHNE